MMPDQTDKAGTIRLEGPDGDRDAQLHTLTVAAELTGRRDLPMVSWSLSPYTDRKWGTNEYETYPTLHGHLHQFGERNNRAALAMWAAAFGAGATEEQPNQHIHVITRFTVRGVPVKIVAVFKPGEPGEPDR